jgi:LacI family transcriptional regulator
MNLSRKAPPKHRSSPRRPRVRLADVAELAGVSLGSASRALSMPDAVKKGTLARVRNAAERLGYVPDGAARALAMGLSRTIGIVLPTINNPIYSDFVHALQKRLWTGDYQLLICAHEYDREVERRQVERLLHRGVDGMVLTGTDHDAATLARLDRANKPVLLTWSVDEVGGRPSVGFSNRRAIQPIVRHLLELGHRRFAVLSGEPSQNERARARLAGIQEVLHGAGIELTKPSVAFGPFSVQAGRAGLRQMWALKPRPTALICTADVFAVGAIAESRDMGLAIPRRLSITGFDDIEVAALLEPALTTVHVPTQSLGELVAERMMAALVSKQALKAAEIETRLVVRASTARPARRE